MKHSILVLLLTLGFHGTLHNTANKSLNLVSYRIHKQARLSKLLDNMSINGIGVQ